jgi:hypothetical protein
MRNGRPHVQEHELDAPELGHPANLRPRADVWPAEPDGRGGVKLTIERQFVDRLGAMRGPGESYRDVILRLAAEA